MQIQLNTDMKELYQNRFGDGEEKAAQAAVSEHFMAHPRMYNGCMKIIEILKHTANLSMYTGQLGLTAAAYNYTHPVISYPIIGATAISGLTILNNLIKTGGSDSSGVISTQARKGLMKRMEKGKE